ETYRRSAYTDLGITEEMQQDNHSRSAAKIVRGMHFQVGAGTAKLVRCGRGAIYDVVVDLRRGSPTYGQWEGFELSDENFHIVYKPHDATALRDPIAQADAIVAQPQWPLVTTWMRSSGARLVFDLFVPEALEALQRYPGGGAWRARLLSAFMADRMSDALRA